MMDNQTNPLRTQILNEIRRVATGQGKPPGRRVFERETGIRESEWRGVFWARWGDALVEAGLSANEKQGQIQKEFILEKLAQAFRHYGRVPTTIELRMYRQVDPEFPVHSTLDNHFSNKAEMLERLRSWLYARREYGDVAALLPAGPITTRAVQATAVSEGSVYLIKAGDYYKIGRSDELERRVKEIRIALPEAATLVHAIRTDDPPGIEAYWHRRFTDRRANGEWFKLLPADIAAFKRRKFQ